MINHLEGLIAAVAAGTVLFFAAVQWLSDGDLDGEVTAIAIGFTVVLFGGMILTLMVLR